MCCYEGEMSYIRNFWRAHGQKGKLTAYEEDGVTVSWIYEGEFLEGKVTGQGTWYYPDRAKAYVGNFDDGHYDGQGTSYRRDGNIREDGAREDGTIEYEGQWKGSCWCGPGTLYLPDGSASPNENWVKGGSGEYEWEKGEEMFWYEGDWDEEGCPHGWGILYRPDRTTVERKEWWQNGKASDVRPPGYPV